MHDNELTWLADQIMEQSVAGWTHGRYELSMKLCTLAQQQSKAGGVAERLTAETAWQRGFTLDKMRGWNACIDAMSAPQPAEQHAGAVVDDAMVERALNAQPFASDNDPIRVWQLINLGTADQKKLARAALTAALAPQPKEAI